MFLNPVDIGNRALDHCGQGPIDFFTDDSKRAAIVARVYDKVRRAELQRKTWTFCTKRAILRAIDANTMRLRPSLWSSSTTYFQGSIVADQNAGMWESTIPDNLNNQPENSTVWEQYTGPQSVMLWSSATTYFSSELVYTTAGDGKARIYRSLQNANSDNPATPTAWDATVTYRKDQVVTRSSVAHMSLIDFNLNQDPASAPVLWAIGTTYAIGNQVGASDGVIYTSVTNGNVGNNPVLDFSGTNWANTGILNPWTTVFVGGAGSTKWLQIGGAEFPFGVALEGLQLIYPIGVGPSTQSTTRNAYLPPANFLRIMSQDPKAGGLSYLGAPYNLLYKDWLFENGLIVTGEVGPLMVRFAADISHVPSMTDMFCEGLAARIAFEVCEPLTQSAEKVKTVAATYEKVMGDARTVDAIEQGPEEPPLDDWLACRG